MGRRSFRACAFLALAALVAGPASAQDPAVGKPPPLPGDPLPGDDPAPAALDPQVDPAAADPPADGSGLIPANRLGNGAQAVGLTVDVRGPAIANLNIPVRLTVVVKNTGEADAFGVTVVDALPPGLEYVSAKPEPTRAGGVLTWDLGTLAAHTERPIELMVKPVDGDSFDHAPTVVLRTGAKARTNVKRPKLKVEVTPSKSQVLKGQPVDFQVTVTNDGSGVARNVRVVATLSSGLRLDGDTPGQHTLTFEEMIPQIGPGQQQRLEALVVTTEAAERQLVEVFAQSDDVEPSPPEARVSTAIDVVEPKLEVTLLAPAQRFPGLIATYTLVVKNAGTSAASRIGVAAYPPEGGEPIVTTGVKFDYDPDKRKLYWSMNKLDVGESREFGFQVKLKALGKYAVRAGAVAQDVAPIWTTATTDVVGMADVRIVDVIERSRALDVGEETEFEIVLKNYGSKEGTGLLVSAKLSDNIEVVNVETGSDQQARKDPADPTRLSFPKIDRLAPSEELVLVVRVKAARPGRAICSVGLLYDDFGDKAIVREAHTTVMPAPEARP